MKVIGKKIIAHLKVLIASFFRKNLLMPKQIRKLNNNNFTIISSTCNGGVIYSDLKQRFNSPTINLFIYPDDFIKLCQNLKFYMCCDLEECKDEDYSYPIGVLNNEIKLYFMHYKSFDEAKEKWDMRKERINYNNIFIIMTDRDGCTQKHIAEFDKLPYENKIIFTCKYYSNYKSMIFCNEFYNKDEVGILSEYRNLRGERLYDRYFNYVEWLNGGKKV